MTPSSKITGMLIDWSNGNEAIFNELLPVVESELRRLARHYIRQLRPGTTMQTTAVINEAYIRLVDQKNTNWQNRAHFFGIAANMMRRILLNYIRDQKRKKRGGGALKISLSEVPLISDERSDELIVLDEALKDLEGFDKRKSRVVELRFFGGLTVDETAEVLQVSKITVIRDWNFAKAWLAREMQNES